MAEFTNEIMARRQNANGLPVLSTRDAQNLYNQMNLLQELGILLGEDGTVPSTAGVPRIFMMGYNEANQDRIIHPSDTEIRIGSEEFFKQVQLGNVFVYPAGQNKPVQMQIKNEDGKFQLGYSKPIDDNKLPEVAAAPPRFYKRWFQRFYKPWRDEVEKFDNRDNDRAYNSSTLHEYENNRFFSDDTKREQKNAEETARDRQQQKEAEVRMKDYLDAQAEETWIDDKMEYVDTMYGPRPQVHKDMLKTKDHVYGYYTQEQFDKLKSYDIKMNSIKTSSGKTFSDEDFAALAFYNTLKPEHLTRTRTLRGNLLEPTGPQSMVEAGLYKTVEEAQRAYDTGAYNFPTTDLFVSGTPRDGNGVIIGGTVQPARQEVYEAFSAYKGGDISKLAKLTAETVTLASKMTASAEGRATSHETIGTFVVADRLADMLEKDPKLQQEALKHGLKQEDLDYVKGISTYYKIQQKALAAKTKLAHAKAYNTDLKEDVKREYLKDIVKGELLQKTFQNDLDENSMHNVTNTMHATEKVYTPPYKKGDDPQKQVDFKLHPENRQKAPEGMIYENAYATYYADYNFNHSLKSPTIKDMTSEKGLANLDKLTDEVIKRENLFDPKESATQLHEKMKGHQYDAKILKEAGQAVKNGNQKIQQEGPEIKQEDPNKNNDKNLEGAAPTV